MKTVSDGEVLRVTQLDRLNSVNSILFKDLVRARLQECHRFVDVDLSAVSFMDSEALGALVAVRRTLAPRNGQVRLRNCTPEVRRFLEMIQFERVVEVGP